MSNNSMSNNRMAPCSTNLGNSFKEAVCIHTRKIYDSCRERQDARYKQPIDAYSKRRNDTLSSKLFCLSRLVLLKYTFVIMDLSNMFFSCGVEDS